MTRIRPLLHIRLLVRTWMAAAIAPIVSIALAALFALFALFAGASTAAAETAHHAAPGIVRGQVLSVDGHSATIVTRRLETRRYTLSGDGVRFGDEVLIREKGQARIATVVSRTDAVTFLATAESAAGSGALSIDVAGTKVTYHASHHLSLILPAHHVSRGTHLLVTVRDTGHFTVSAQLASGAPTQGAVSSTGVVIATSGRNVTLLTSTGHHVHVTLPADMGNHAGISHCTPVSLYYTPGAGNRVSMVSPSNDGPISGCQHLEAGYGFVRAVAADDTTLAVRTDKGTIVLHVETPTLRAEVDSVSITDYVIVTYVSDHGQLTLETVDDTSNSDMAVARVVTRSTLKVRTWDLGDLTLTAARPHMLHAVKPGDAVDIDYFTAFDGTLWLVNLDDRGPARNGGNGGGPSGSGGSAGSAGSGGSWGSWGSASA